MSESSKSILRKRDTYLIEGCTEANLFSKFQVGTTDGVKILRIGGHFSKLFLVNRKGENVEGAEINIYEVQGEFQKRNLVDFIGEENSITLGQMWAILRGISENGCRKELRAVIRNNHANIFLVRDSMGVARIVYSYYNNGGWAISCPPTSPGQDDWLKYRRVIARNSKKSNSS